MIQGNAKENMINVFRLGIGREENDSALLPQSRQHIASAKYTIDIMAEAPIIVFVVNSLGKSIMEELTTEERVYEICNIQSITVFDKGIIINHNKNRANLH